MVLRTRASSKPASKTGTKGAAPAKSNSVPNPSSFLTPTAGLQKSLRGLLTELCPDTVYIEGMEPDQIWSQLVDQAPSDILARGAEMAASGYVKRPAAPVPAPESDVDEEVDDTTGFEAMTGKRNTSSQRAKAEAKKKKAKKSRDEEEDDDDDDDDEDEDGMDDEEDDEEDDDGEGFGGFGEEEDEDDEEDEEDDDDDDLGGEMGDGFGFGEGDDDDDDDDDDGGRGAARGRKEKTLPSARGDKVAASGTTRGKHARDDAVDDVDGEKRAAREIAALAKDTSVAARLELERKPWRLEGEVSAADRPRDSLLEIDADFDRAVLPRVEPTAEVLKSVERMIQERIAAGKFDDVIVKVAATVETAIDDAIERAKNGGQGGAADPAADPRHRLSLVDMYEKDYIDKVRGAAAAGGPEGGGALGAVGLAAARHSSALTEEERAEAAAIEAWRDVQSLLAALSNATVVTASAAVRASAASDPVSVTKRGTASTAAAATAAATLADGSGTRSGSGDRQLAFVESSAAAVDDVRLVAPHEVAPQQRGMLAGVAAEELTHDERRRLRRTRKSATAARETRTAQRDVVIAGAKAAAEAAIAREDRAVNAALTMQCPYLFIHLTPERPGRRLGEKGAVKEMLRINDVSNSRSDPIRKMAVKEVFTEERKKVGDELRNTRMGVLGLTRPSDVTAARRRAGVSVTRKRARGPAAMGL